MENIDDNLVVNNHIAAYLEFINKFKILSKKEIIALYQNKDYETIFFHNLRLVPYTARRFAKNVGLLSFMDLIQEGNIGLMEAIKRYDYQLNTEFSTFAIPYITQRISILVATQSRTISYTYNMHYKIVKYKKCVSKLYLTLGWMPTKEEIAKESKLNLKQIDDILNNMVMTLSIDEPIKTESGVIQENNVLVIQDYQEDEAINRVILDKLIKYAKLSKKEMDILRLYFFEENSSKEISQKYNCTRQNIEGMIKNILVKLKMANEEIASPKVKSLKDIEVNNFYYYLRCCSVKQLILCFRNFTNDLIEMIFSYSLLNDEEKLVLTLLLGINQYYVLSYNDIASMKGLPVERIKEIAKVAMRKMAELVKLLYPTASQGRNLVKKKV